jgi:hypothetical protein
MASDDLTHTSLPKLLTLKNAQIYRVGKLKDAWSRRSSWREPSASRYDDPLGLYQTIYATSLRYDAYLAVLADFRPGPNADIAAKITRNAEFEEADAEALPQMAVTQWIAGRFLGQGSLTGTFVDLTDQQSVDFLFGRPGLKELFKQHDISERDADTLTHAPRKVTMEISRTVSELEYRIGKRFDGIFYRSRLGGGINRWAIFDKNGTLSAVTPKRSKQIDPSDPDLRRALEEYDIDTAPATPVWRLA